MPWDSVANDNAAEPQLLQDMSQLSSAEFVSFFKNIDCVMFDCDGVLWIGDNVFRGSDILVKRLRFLGKRIFFVTNNSTRTRTELRDKFNKLGFGAEMDEVISPCHLAALHLKERNFTKKVYAIGPQALIDELKAVNIRGLPIGADNVPDDCGRWLGSDEAQKMTLDPDVGAVIVGFDQYFSYKKMFIAASYLKSKDVMFIATNTDERYPGKASHLVMPDTGSIMKAVQTAAGREPFVIGKPFPTMFDFIQRTFKVDPKKTLMVGDRANTDILFGRKCDLWTLLVLSGVTTLEEAQYWKDSGSDQEKECVPHFFLNEVHDFLELMTSNGF